MTATEQHTDEVPITWTRKAEWGYDTLTHRAEATINDETWSFHIGQHGKGQWVARGWRDGNMALYRDVKTLREAKATVQAKANYAATQTCLVCRNIGGHTPACIRTVTEYVNAVREGMAKLAPVAQRAAEAISGWIESLTTGCDCPTPTHRMSCGVNATPKVVSR